MAKFLVSTSRTMAGKQWAVMVEVEVKTIKELDDHVLWLSGQGFDPVGPPTSSSTPMPQAVAYASKLPSEQICPIHKCSMVRSKFPDKGLVDTHFCPTAIGVDRSTGDSDYCKVKCSLDQNGILRWVNVT